MTRTRATPFSFIFLFLFTVLYKVVRGRSGNFYYQMTENLAARVLSNRIYSAKGIRESDSGDVVFIAHYPRTGAVYSMSFHTASNFTKGLSLG